MNETFRAECRELMDRYPQARSALLPMLHLAQSVDGYVTPAAIETCAELLDLSTAEVAGVATFYTMFKRHKAGDYHVGVCTNTLCAVLGGDAIWEALSERVGAGHDEISANGRVSLERIECQAACTHAPVMTANWEFLDNMSVESALELIEKIEAGEDIHSSRGPRVRSFVEIERTLAGYDDGLAGEGGGPDEAMAAGTTYAREHGMKAPASPDRSPFQATSVVERGRAGSSAETDRGAS